MLFLYYIHYETSKQKKKFLYKNKLYIIKIMAFNIVGMKFDNIKKSYNIFNKHIVLDSYEIFNKILDIDEFSDNNVEDYEIMYLNDIISDVKVEDKKTLKRIIAFYDKYYPNDSLNWLDVSGITEMLHLFAFTSYNGDSADGTYPMYL